MKSGNYAKAGVLVLFVTLILGNYFQYQLSPLAPRLMESMHMTPVQFSSAFSAPMIPAILLGIVAGIMSDKFGVKKVTSVGLVVTMAGLCYRPFAGDYTSLMASMVLAGIGVTFINVNMSKLVGAWYPPEKVGQMVGVTMVGSTLGMTLGTATTAMFPSVRSAFVLTGILSVFIVVLWVVFIHDGSGQAAEGNGPQESVLTSIMTVVKSRNIWLVGICLMCILGCNVALSSFLPTALQSRGINESMAGVVSSVLTIGSLLGTFMGPTIIARIGRMKPALVTLALVTAAGTAFGWMAPVWLIVVALLAAGFGMGSLIPTFMSFPMLLPEIGPSYAGSAGGVITTLELLGAVVIPTYIITPVAGQNFHTYFMMAGAVMVLMAAVALFLPELYQKGE